MRMVSLFFMFDKLTKGGTWVSVCSVGLSGSWQMINVSIAQQSFLGDFSLKVFKEE